MRPGAFSSGHPINCGRCKYRSDRDTARKHEHQLCEQSKKGYLGSPCLLARVSRRLACYKLRGATMTQAPAIATLRCPRHALLYVPVSEPTPAAAGGAV